MPDGVVEDIQQLLPADVSKIQRVFCVSEYGTSERQAFNLSGRRDPGLRRLATVGGELPKQDQNEKPLREKRLLLECLPGSP